MENPCDVNISEHKLSKLMKQLRSDKNPTSKLGLLENEPSVCPKKNPEISPLRTKEFLKISEGNFFPVAPLQQVVPVIQKLAVKTVN